MLQDYDAIIQDQLSSGIVELAPEPASKKEFYIPHWPVVKETFETTKLCIVYDASACDRPDAPSLNECLHAGPPLLNECGVSWSEIAYTQLLWQVTYVKHSCKPGFVNQSVDALRFHWWADLSCTEVIILRFT